MPSDNQKPNRIADLCDASEQSSCATSLDQLHFLTTGGSEPTEEDQRYSLDQFRGLWSKFGEELQRNRIACAVAAKVSGREYSLRITRVVNDQDRVQFED